MTSPALRGLKDDAGGGGDYLMDSRSASKQTCTAAGVHLTAASACMPERREGIDGGTEVVSVRVSKFFGAYSSYVEGKFDRKIRKAIHT